MLQSFKMLIVLIMLVALIVACTGAATERPTELAVSSPSSNIASPLNITLSESYTGQNELVNASLTVNYPAGWVSQGAGTQILLASQNPDTITADTDAILVTVQPVGDDVLASISERTVASVLANIMRDTVGETAPMSEIMLNNRSSAVATGQLDANNAILYVLEFGTDTYIALTAIKSQPFTEEQSALIEAMAAQLTYDAGAIPQSQ